MRILIVPVLMKQDEELDDADLYFSYKTRSENNK